MNLIETKINAKERYNICKNCDSFIKMTKVCKECWCFLPAKTKILQEKCPLDKWTRQQLMKDRRLD